MEVTILTEDGEEQTHNGVSCVRTFDRADGGHNIELWDGPYSDGHSNMFECLRNATVLRVDE